MKKLSGLAAMCGVIVFLASAPVAGDPTSSAAIDRVLPASASMATVHTVSSSAPNAEAFAPRPSVKIESAGASGLWGALDKLMFGVGFDVLAWLIMAVLGLIGTLFGFLARFIIAKTGNEKIGAITKRVGVALERSVKATWQVYVKSIKKSKEDGTLTPEEKQEAMKRAIQYAKSYLGPNGIKEFIWIMGLDGSKLDSTLGDMLEATLAKVRDEASKANPTKAL